MAGKREGQKKKKYHVNPVYPVYFFAIVQYPP